jgi:hypothetical protein
VDRVAARLVRHQFLQRRQQRSSPVDHVFPAIQVLTNVDNWRTIQLSASAAAAAALFGATHPVVGAPLASCTALAGTYAASSLHTLAHLSARATTFVAHHLAPHKRLLVGASSMVASSAGASIGDLHRAPADMQRASLGRRAMQRAAHAASSARALVARASVRAGHGAAHSVDMLYMRARRRPTRASPQVASLSTTVAQRLTGWRVHEHIAPVVQHSSMALQSVPRHVSRCAASAPALACSAGASLQGALGKAAAVANQRRVAFVKQLPAGKL